MDQPAEGRMERKKEETANRIIDTAIALFDQYGLDAVTMEQIARVADVAKGTLYNYFPAKEAIIAAYMQRTFMQRNPQRLTDLRTLPDTRARLKAIFSVLIEGVRSKKEIFEAFMVYRMKQVISFQPDESKRSGLGRLSSEIVRMGLESGELRSDLPAECLEDLFDFALIEAIKPLYTRPETFDPQHSIDQSVDLFLNGAKARP